MSIVMNTSPLYLPMRGFVTVCTPHAIDQTLARTQQGIVEFLAASNVNLERVYRECTPETCHWIPIGIFLLYVKRKYNKSRHRHELELISLTPGRRKRTKNRDFSEGVNKQVVETESAFPAWFNAE